MTELVLRGVAGLVALSLAAVTVVAVVHLLGAVPYRESPWRLVVAIGALCAAWLLINSPVEGRVLWSPTHTHGVTVGDLAVLPAVLVALLLAYGHARS